MADTRPELIAQAFATKALTIAAVASSNSYEPDRLGRLPAVTVLLVQVGQEDVETGAATENSWGFRVNVYVQLSDWQKAQAELTRLLPEVLAITRRSPDLDGACSYARISDEGEEPVFAPDERLLRKSLRLTAVTAEY